MLTVLVQTAVDAVGIELSAIDAFAVGKGPGSYTGLRVATSVVKGLCFALDKPLIGVNTLEAMALQVRESLLAGATLTAPNDLLLVPMIDARRMEVYCAVYDIEGNTVAETAPVIVEADSFDQWRTQNRIVFLGDGAPKCRPLLAGLPGVVFWDQEIHPQASAVGTLAFSQYIKGLMEDPATFEPLYLKEFMTKQSQSGVRQ